MINDGMPTFSLTLMLTHSVSYPLCSLMFVYSGCFCVMLDFTILNIYAISIEACSAVTIITINSSEEVVYMSSHLIGGDSGVGTLPVRYL